MTLTFIHCNIFIVLQPDEDITDDYLFPLSNRIAYSGGRDSDFDISRPLDDLDVHTL